VSKRLGQILVDHDKVTADKIKQAVDAQVLYGRRLGTNLLEKGFIDEETLVKALCFQQQATPLHPKFFEMPSSTALKLIPEDVAKKLLIVPVDLKSGQLLLAMASPSDMTTINLVQEKTGRVVFPALAAEYRIMIMLERFYGIDRDLRFSISSRIDGQLYAPSAKSRKKGQRILAADGELVAAESTEDLLTEEVFDQTIVSAYAKTEPEPETPQAVPPVAPPAAPPVAPPAAPPVAPPVAPPAQPVAPPVAPPAQPVAPPVAPPAAAPAPPVASPVAAPPAQPVAPTAAVPPAAPPIAVPPVAAPPVQPATPPPAPAPPVAPPAAPPVAAPPAPAPPVAPPVAPVIDQVEDDFTETEFIQDESVFEFSVNKDILLTEEEKPQVQIDPEETFELTEVEPHQAPMMPRVSEDDDASIFEFHDKREIPAGFGEDTADDEIIDEEELQEISSADFLDAIEETVDTVTAEQIGPLTLQEAIARLDQVENRFELSQILLAFTKSYFKRSVLLMVREDVVFGWDGLAPGLISSDFERIFISLDEQSVFKLICMAGGHYLGPLPQVPINDRFLQLLGIGRPSTAFLITVSYNGKVVNILYGDNGPDTTVTTDITDLLILAQKIPLAFSKIIKRTEK
jgi:MshEN domain